MALRSPKHGLTRSGRGWYRRVGKKPRWIVSAAVCPTGAEADAYFEANFSALAAGPVSRSRVTVRQAAGAFVGHKEGKRLHPKTIRSYDDTMLLLMRTVGDERTVAALDRANAAAIEQRMSHLGTSRRTMYVVMLRGFIAWCGREGIECGWTRETFTPPTKSERRRERATKGMRPYTHQEIRRLLRNGSDKMRAIILLGLNAALGPDELTKLTAADVRGGSIDKMRQKTGVERLIPLWPETVAALPKRTGLLFGTERGTQLDPDHMTRYFLDLCVRAAVKPRGLYNLRRTFRTVADEYGDQRAAAKVMGRETGDMDSVYVLHISRERIARMLDHVKSVLRIGPALAARRYGRVGLATRLAARRVRLGTAKPAKPPGKTATARRASARATRPPRPDA